MSGINQEETVQALELKIKELTELSIKHSLNLSKEIAELNHKLRKIKRELYENLTSWEKVQLARHSQRPTSMDYIELIFDDFIELHGDRNYADDLAIIGGIGKLNGVAVTILGQQKGRDTKENIKRNFGMMHPEGYRKALRLMQQAEKFKRPIICLIDTPGAYCGFGAEERGQGEAIAKNLMEMAGLKTPIISIIIGEGGSGGALALGVGNKVMMLENAIYSVLSPEGFATILWKDSTKASHAAELMKITAKELKEFGIIDKSIKEPLGGAHKDLKETAWNMKSAIETELKELMEMNTEMLLNQRYDKFRNIGAYREEEA